MTTTKITSKMTDQEMRDVLRQMLADWEKMTPAQQEVTAMGARFNAEQARTTSLQGRYWTK